MVDWRLPCLAATKMHVFLFAYYEIKLVVVGGHAEHGPHHCVFWEAFTTVTTGFSILVLFVSTM